MTRALIDLLPPGVVIECVAGRECSPQSVTIDGGTLTSPVMTMRTAGGDLFTADPGVGAATMPDPTSLKISWTAADTAALNRGTRLRVFRWHVDGTIDGGSVSPILAGELRVHPSTYGRVVPTVNLGRLTLNNGTTIALAVTVPAPDGPIDGGTHDDLYGGTTGIDGGSHDSTFTDTTYDGGSI